MANEHNSDVLSDGDIKDLQAVRNYLNRIESPEKLREAVERVPAELNLDDKQAKALVRLFNENDRAREIGCSVHQIVTMSESLTKDKGVLFQQLFDFITRSPLLGSDSERTVAFCAALLDKRLFSLPVERNAIVSMSDEEFRSKIETLKPTIQQLEQVATYPFEQATEEASAYISLIETLGDDTEGRAVLLAVLLKAKHAAGYKAGTKAAES